MKTLAAALILLSTSIAAAEPGNLGFGERAPLAPRPLTVAALPAPVVAEDGGGVTFPAAEPAERPRTIFGLPKNVGPGDRVLRTVVGVALLGTGIWGLTSDDHLSDTTSGVLMGVSAVPLATAATGYCPLYQLVGIDRSF